MDKARSPNMPPTVHELTVTPTTTQIFSFSAITWNRHRIHYDKDAALAEGHADVVVQRALLGNFFALLLERWLGEYGEVRKLSWKVVNSAVPDQQLRCVGEASIDEANTAHCEMSIKDESGTLIATGSAECILKASAQ